MSRASRRGNPMTSSTCRGCRPSRRGRIVSVARNHRIERQYRRPARDSGFESLHEAEIWTEFLRKLALPAGREFPRMPQGGVSKVLSAIWQRRRVDLQGNALAHAGKSGLGVAPDFIVTAFARDAAGAAAPNGAPWPTRSAPRYRNWHHDGGGRTRRPWFTRPS